MPSSILLVVGVLRRHSVNRHDSLVAALHRAVAGADNCALGAAFILDAFTGRGIIDTNADQSQLDSIAMMHDAFAALGKLATHPRIDPARIAAMGFSRERLPRSTPATGAFERPMALAMLSSRHISGSILPVM